MIWWPSGVGMWLAASAEYGSEHPLGEAIVRAASERKLEVSPASDFNSIPGHGVEASSGPLLFDPKVVKK
jgi:cation transport ATPase